MRQRLKTIGQQAAIVLDRPLLDALQATPEQEVEIVSKGDALIVRAVHSIDRNPIAEAFQRVIKESEMRSNDPGSRARYADVLP